MSKVLTGIIQPKDDTTLWRYMSFEKIDVEPFLHDDPYEFGIFLEINVKTLFGKNSEVIVSPHADTWVAGTLELIVERYGFQFPVNRSKLLDPPT